METPRAVNSVLSAYFPDYGWGEFELVERFMGYVRPVGYLCLIAVVFLIVVGFATGRGSLSSLGAVAFFLPTFGYFASSMFFLAGIGVLRVLWIPFWDSYVKLLKLGDIAYIPYMII